MRAVIFTGGKQYIVGVGDTLKVESLKTKDKKFTFDKVLMTFDPKSGDANIGKPFLKGVKVEADIIEEGRTKKLTVIKFKAKSHYRRKHGHRQHFTKVKVTKIA